MVSSLVKKKWCLARRKHEKKIKLAILKRENTYAVQKTAREYQVKKRALRQEV